MKNPTLRPIQTNGWVSAEDCKYFCIRSEYVCPFFCGVCADGKQVACMKEATEAPEGQEK